jgi:uncharacterized protein (DUF1501 family)
MNSINNLHRHQPLQPQVVSRRQFLSMLGVSATAITAADALTNEAAAATRKKQASKKPTAKGSPSGKVTPGADRPGPNVLVVIELQGGNDGFSMLVPSGDGRFRQLRDRVWLNPKDIDAYGDGYSITKGLAPLSKQLAFVEGVGVAKPDLSHTSMMTRWWQGDPDGSGRTRTGFLGRCADLLIDSGPIVGVSIGGGSTPALISDRAPTVALPDLGSLRELTDDRDARMRPTFAALTDGGGDIAGLDGVDPALIANARAGLASGLSIVGGLGSVTGKAPGYPDNQLAKSLSMARELIGLNAGIRIIHIPWGSFDTHTSHAWSHPDQMRQLGSALVAFWNDLVRTGLSRRVLTATTSEFGRRPQANAGGTDHGTASTALLLGPVRAGRHGGPVNFVALDQAGNPAATVNMTDYYATLASWLKVPASAVLPFGGSPLSTLGI